MNNRGESLFIYLFIALALLGALMIIEADDPSVPIAPAIEHNTDLSINPGIFVFSERTKFDNCSFEYLPYPDPECSPGAVFVNATVDIICVPGYSASVRAVSESLKNQVYRSYNVYSREPYEYEIDHIVSLQLGGSNDIANLYPEKYNMTLGAHDKDRVENLLHRMVCNGSISLQQAQYDIAYNWTKYLEGD
jgi:hypothetical protein